MRRENVSTGFFSVGIGRRYSCYRDLFCIQKWREYSIAKFVAFPVAVNRVQPFVQLEGPVRPGDDVRMNL